MEEENVNVEMEHKDKSCLNKVTPLSKYLALTLFIALPFVGGWIGYNYAPEKVVEIERVVVIEKEVPENEKVAQITDVLLIDASGHETESLDPDSEAPDGWTQYKNTDYGFSFAYPIGWGDVYLGDVHYGTEEQAGPRQEIYFSSFGGDNMQKPLIKDQPEIAISSLDFGGIGTGRPLAVGAGYKMVSDGYVVTGLSNEWTLSEDNTLALEIVNGGLFFVRNDELHQVDTTKVIFNINDNSYSGLSFIIHDEVGQTANLEILRSIAKSVVVE